MTKNEMIEKLVEKVRALTSRLPERDDYVLGNGFGGFGLSMLGISTKGYWEKGAALRTERRYLESVKFVTVKNLEEAVAPAVMKATGDEFPCFGYFKSTDGKWHGAIGAEIRDNTLQPLMQDWVTIGKISPATLRKQTLTDVRNGLKTMLKETKEKLKRRLEEIQKELNELAKDDVMRVFDERKGNK